MNEFAAGCRRHQTQTRAEQHQLDNELVHSKAAAAAAICTVGLFVDLAMPRHRDIPATTVGTGSVLGIVMST